MNNFKIQYEVCLLKRLYNDIDFYKIGLKEILLYLEIRSEVMQRFKYNTSELYKYVQMGEILEDIKQNYIEYESVCNEDGEIVDFKKVYQVRAERVIFDTQMFIIQLEEDDDIDEKYIRGIKMELAKYESKNIFTELLLLEELLLAVNSEKVLMYDGSDDFINKLNKFNALDELAKYNMLNEFCYDVIEKNVFIDALIRIYNDYQGGYLYGMSAVLRLIRIRGGWNRCINMRYINPTIMGMDKEFYDNYMHANNYNC